MGEFINPITGREEGTEVSQKRAKNMIELLFWQKFKEKYHLSTTTHDERIEIMNEIVSIDFSKEILQKILKPNECHGIRFYFAKRDDRPEDETLVLVGYGADSNDLTSTSSEGSIILDSNIAETVEKNRTTIVEVGGGKKLKDYWDGTSSPKIITDNNTAFEKGMSRYFTNLMYIESN